MGKEMPLHATPNAIERWRLETLFKGDAAVLLVDEENKVAVIAFVPDKIK
jgi:hypothetical protein